MTKIKVGDIVVGYHKGYHVVTALEERATTSSPLVRYTKVINENGTPAKAIKKACDASWCRVVNDSYIDEEIKKHTDRLESIRKQIHEFNAKKKNPPEIE